MNQDIRDLIPITVWNHFSDLNAVPRASKKEEKVVAFMLAFGKQLGLETLVDSVQNVIIKKPATPGMENKKTLVLQSHLDMVHQKNSDTLFDFNKEGINMTIEGDWVTAQGTTLGADNGMGVAAIMGILSSKDIQHPALEALFTIDEETGMTGAMGLEAGYLKGDILLNLDTEEDDEIDIGCAGGIDVTAVKTYALQAMPKKSMAFKLLVTGLNGGHSGMDIHKGLGNANKIMNQLLLEVGDLIQIISINGGSLRNAIPRESFATVMISPEQKDQFLETITEISNLIKIDFIKIEKNLLIELEPVSVDFDSGLNKKDQSQLLNALKHAHNGVHKMSEFMTDLVETSNNIAKVLVANGEISIKCLTRSSIDEGKKELAGLLTNVFENEGFQVKLSGSYPGWQPDKNSEILKVMKDLYETMFAKQPKIVACHAGLECGILGKNYPQMDMISFGPTIKGAHSPDERVSITSVQKFWKFLIEILKHSPDKK